MESKLRDLIRRTDDLLENNKKARYAAYAIVILALATAVFGLGERLGAFAFLITH
ncbi:MAG: hypothetical protein IK020_06010 [Clostridiales bacterium]|nr:hypothetical protein [Clostridiales bacterium]MBR5974721.1 hypothetical protein [Clostridiales bacterium]